MASSRNEIRYRLTLPNRPALPPPRAADVPAQLPRIARLMALAIKLDGMRKEPAGGSDAEWARLGRVSRSRMSQILNLRLLAPDIQERLLFLEPVSRGREPVHERALRQVTRHIDWGEQRRALERIVAKPSAL
jgi:hypothetical protein